MDSTRTLPANDVAERIVRHFQDAGFTGISEALILRIGLRDASRKDIDDAFEEALEHDRMPPVQECFEIRAAGHYSTTREFVQAREALRNDFSHALRIELPKIYFAPAPVLVDDAFATGSKYDVMIKLTDNIAGHAFAILLNDPDASFMDYLGGHHGSEWTAVLDNLESAAMALGPELDFT